MAGRWRGRQALGEADGGPLGLRRRAAASHRAPRLNVKGNAGLGPRRSGRRRSSGGRAPSLQALRPRSPASQRRRSSGGRRTGWGG
ncbi:hypothetical protein NL676_007237 [Syzygium grande]|nr:hypothetical protein NL676_007237 [Syzygium grande]